jgi:hypothetical protein
MDRHKLEFESKMHTVDNLNMKLKRQLYSTMRDGASMHVFFPRLGLTIGEMCSFLVLKDKA